MKVITDNIISADLRINESLNNISVVEVKKNVNGVYAIEDTAIVETWYRPDIRSKCRIALETEEVYDILGEPEDINRRHQFLKFKVRRVTGGV